MRAPTSSEESPAPRPALRSRFSERVRRNYERMRQPSYGWWIVAVIPGAYSMLVALTYVFEDVSFVDALKLSPESRQFLVVVVIGTLFELAVHQFLTRRPHTDEPGSGQTVSEPSTTDAHAEPVSR